VVPRHCFVLALALALLTAVPAAAQGNSLAPLDLAAMSPTPADLAVAGWEGLGFASGQTLSAADLAYRAVWPQGGGKSQESIHKALLDAGWQHGYAATFATFWDPDRSDPGRQVEIEIVAYADAAGAAKGFALVPDVFPTGPMTTVAGASRIGDEARLVRVAARDPQAGTPSHELALGFRHGRLTARILLRDWMSEEPAMTVVEALAARLLARIERVLDDGGSGLSLHALRVERLEYAYQSESYVRFAGEDIRSTYESPAAFATRVAGYGVARDVFTSGTEIAAHDGGDNLSFGADLYRFPDEQRASAWLRDVPDRLDEDVDVTALVIENDIADIGDEAMAVTSTRDPGRDGIEVIHTVAVLFRNGAVVAESRLTRAYDPPPVAVALALADAQAACLVAADCFHALPTPAS
jgi:hypothetical protein